MDKMSTLEISKTDKSIATPSKATLDRVMSYAKAVNAVEVNNEKIIVVKN